MACQNKCDIITEGLRVRPFVTLGSGVARALGENIYDKHWFCVLCHIWLERVFLIGNRCPCCHYILRTRPHSKCMLTREHKRY